MKDEIINSSTSENINSHANMNPAYEISLVLQLGVSIITGVINEVYMALILFLILLNRLVRENLPCSKTSSMTIDKNRRRSNRKRIEKVIIMFIIKLLN